MYSVDICFGAAEVSFSTPLLQFVYLLCVHLTSWRHELVVSVNQMIVTMAARCLPFRINYFSKIKDMPTLDAYYMLC